MDVNESDGLGGDAGAGVRICVGLGIMPGEGFEGGSQVGGSLICSSGFILSLFTILSCLFLWKGRAAG
jgi:hypothetical protein